MAWVEFSTLPNGPGDTRPDDYEARVPNPEDKPVKDIRDKFGFRITAREVCYTDAHVYLHFDRPVIEAEVAL
jgi:hypothetical protein